MSAKPLLKIVATGLKPSRPTSPAALEKKRLEAQCAAALKKCLKDDPIFAEKYKEECAQRSWNYP